MSFKQSIIGFFAALTLQAQATEFLSTTNYFVAKGQTVADEQWVAAATAFTEGEFKNDLFIASGDQLKLDGTYAGNIWGAAGMNASLGGPCQRNVRLAGKSVQVNNTVGGNLMALAETIMIGTNAVIEGRVRLLGTSVVQEGRINGDAVITAGRLVTLDGIIEGDLKIIAPDILFAPGARIAGDLDYTTSKELVPAEGVVGGTLTRIVPQAEPRFSAARLQAHAMWFLAALFAGIPFITLFPMSTAMATQLARKSPLKCLLIGLVASAGLPLFGLMGISSVIGIPLGSLLLASWGILAYISRIISGLVIGTLILRSAGNSVSRVLLTMALGLAVIYLAVLIPSIGPPVQMVVMWLGMGALILALLEKRRLIIQVPHNLKKLEDLRNEEYNPAEEES